VAASRWRGIRFLSGIDNGPSDFGPQGFGFTILTNAEKTGREFHFMQGAIVVDIQNNTANPARHVCKGYFGAFVLHGVRVVVGIQTR